MESGYFASHAVPMSDQLQDVRRLENEFADAMNRMYAVGNGLARMRAALEVQTATTPESWAQRAADPAPAAPTAPQQSTQTPQSMPSPAMAPAAAPVPGRPAMPQQPHALA